MAQRFFLLLCLLPFLFCIPTAFADTQSPIFSSCPTPHGTAIAAYDSGSHAIAGQGMQDGSDHVYSVDVDLSQVTQCFCPTDHTTGTQTNWLQASNLSDSEKQSLRDTGWMYIADGSTWGLAQAPYFAQNVTFSCNGQTTITAIVQSSDQTNGSSSDSNTADSSHADSSSDVPGSSSSQLPDTGGSVKLLGTITLSFFLLGISFFIKKIIR